MDTLLQMQGFVKAIFLIVTFPVWGKVMRAMWLELQRGLAADGGVFGGAEIDASPRPPGLDPFLNIPRAEHRRARGAATPPADSNERASATPKAAKGPTPKPLLGSRKSAPARKPHF